MKVMGANNCLVLQNIFFCVQTFHTGLERFIFEWTIPLNAPSLNGVKIHQVHVILLFYFFWTRSVYLRFIICKKYKWHQHAANPTFLPIRHKESITLFKERPNREREKKKHTIIHILGLYSLLVFFNKWQERLPDCIEFSGKTLEESLIFSVHVILTKKKSRE